MVVGAATAASGTSFWRAADRHSNGCHDGRSSGCSMSSVGTETAATPVGGVVFAAAGAQQRVPQLNATTGAALDAASKLVPCRYSKSIL